MVASYQRCGLYSVQFIPSSPPSTFRTQTVVYQWASTITVHSACSSLASLPQVTKSRHSAHLLEHPNVFSQFLTRERRRLRLRQEDMWTYRLSRTRSGRFASSFSGGHHAGWLRPRARPLCCYSTTQSMSASFITYTPPPPPPPPPPAPPLSLRHAA